MALEIKLSQKLSQNLLMTPQLQQAIKLLQLGRQDYLEAIQKELIENPVIEEVAEDDNSQKKNDKQTKEDSQATLETAEANPIEKKEEQSLQDAGPVSWEDYLQSFSDARGAATPKGLTDSEDRPSLEATLTKTESLTDHLFSQLQFQDLEEGQKNIVLHIIGNLDKYGYLRCSDEEILSACECSEDHFKDALEVVQSLEPAGVGAREIGECLLLQLEGQGLGGALPGRIVKNHLELLEKRKYDKIAKAENTAVEEVYEAVKLIQELEPRPGVMFADDTIRYITPDIYVYKYKNEYVITLNEDGLPKLRVSPYYLTLLQKQGKDEDSSKEYLTDRLKAASWLIKSIHQRQQTIFKVTESIVKFQGEFLDHGIEKLKPMVLKDVAEDIEMHESTVSRVTSNKYVHTPQGVFELKYFFSTGLKSGSGEISSSSIKNKIKSIISAEEPAKPISDQAIVDKLAEESIEIARRTVAKYRENLGILSSSKRKKLF